MAVSVLLEDSAALIGVAVAGNFYLFGILAHSLKRLQYCSLISRKIHSLTL